MVTAITRLCDEVFAGGELRWAKAKFGPARDLVGVEGPDAFYLRRRTSSVVFVVPKSFSGEHYVPKCYTCDGEIDAKTVSNSVHLRNGPGPLAGTGEVRREVVPYCGNCESEPPSSGIIYEDLIPSAEDLF